MYIEAFSFIPFSLAELVEKKQALSIACSKVLATKTRLQLSRLAYDQRKKSVRQGKKRGGPYVVGEFIMWGYV